MNRQLSAALSFAAVTTAAFAAAGALVLPPAATAGMLGDITVEDTPFVSTATRDEVRAGIGAGTQMRGDIEWIAPVAVAPSSTLTTAQVRAQYRAAREEVHALTSEDSGSEFLRQHAHAAERATMMGGPAEGTTPADVLTDGTAVDNVAGLSE